MSAQQPTAEQPLTGRCACGTVHFSVSAPFEAARYCHCHNCQRRTGTSSSPNARVAAGAFTISRGEEALRAWQPQGGQAKWYCAECGGHLFSRPDDGKHVYVRMGALDADPGIRPEYRQWVSSAAPWEPIPDDGLPRFDGAGS
ncbi:MAG TPA: GFA family protein [Solirubrobacteraceae bacterium]|jgi:hypothetical protein|nr:GFA family protein [Solirubrobacteraceae bacterium]